MGCGQDHEPTGLQKKDKPKKNDPSPNFSWSQISDPMHNAQQPLHISEGMLMCGVGHHSLEQELHSRKLYFCWSSALPNHCLKEADEANTNSSSQGDNRKWAMDSKKVQELLSLNAQWFTLFSISEKARGRRELHHRLYSACCGGTTGQMSGDPPGHPAHSAPGGAARPDLEILGNGLTQVSKRLQNKTF